MANDFVKTSYGDFIKGRIHYVIAFNEFFSKGEVNQRTRESWRKFIEETGATSIRDYANKFDERHSNK